MRKNNCWFMLVALVALWTWIIMAFVNIQSWIPGLVGVLFSVSYMFIASKNKKLKLPRLSLKMLYMIGLFCAMMTNMVINADGNIIIATPLMQLIVPVFAFVYNEIYKK